MLRNFDAKVKIGEIKTVKPLSEYGDMIIKINLKLNVHSTTQQSILSYWADWNLDTTLKS